MSDLPRRFRLLPCLALMLSGAPALAAEPATPPPLIADALKAAHLPASALYLWIALAGADEPLLAWQASQPVNPASLMKLATSTVALAQLGPGYRWRTEITADLAPQDGRLRGNLYVNGRGDPQITMERLWLMLQTLRQRGVQQIDGDIVLDQRAFDVPAVDPGAFDGEPYKPYNVQPEALVINYKAVTLQFHPQPTERVARVWSEPPLAGWSVPATVPLTGDTDCGDWRGRLKADFTDPAGVRLAGSLPAVCGDKAWPVATAAPQRYNAQAIAAMWTAVGGTLSGRVRMGQRTTTAVPLFEVTSPTLAEVLRDMNKFSNNLMADQLMLTLALEAQGQGNWTEARRLMRDALQTQARCQPDEMTIDRGSGLSRIGRLSARCLGQILQWAWVNPWMPELAASLPLAGEDTAKRATAAAGRAHLKTGSLEGVAGLAGFVDGQRGQRYILVALLNHPRAGEGREVLNAALRWVVQRADGRP